MAVIRRFEELVAWQLARELERRVYALLRRSAAKRDVDFCRQIRKSSSSAPHVSAREHAEIIHLSDRAIGAATRFVEYLDRSGAAWKKNFLLRQQRHQSQANERERPTQRGNSVPGTRTKNREP